MMMNTTSTKERISVMDGDRRSGGRHNSNSDARDNWQRLSPYTNYSQHQQQHQQHNRQQVALPVMPSLGDTGGVAMANNSSSSSSSNGRGDDYYLAATSGLTTHPPFSPYALQGGHLPLSMLPSSRRHVSASIHRATNPDPQHRCRSCDDETSGGGSGGGGRVTLDKTEEMRSVFQRLRVRSETRSKRRK
jgi:hypothetical protein